MTFSLLYAAIGVGGAHGNYLYTPPPRNTADLENYMIPPREAPTVDLARHCKGVEKQAFKVRDIKRYMQLYQPHEKIDETTTPMPRWWKATYAWELYRIAALADIRRGFMDSAEEGLLKLLEVMPDDRPDQQALAYLYLSVIHSYKSNIDLAEQYITMATEANDQGVSQYDADIRKRYQQSLSHSLGSLEFVKGNMKEAESYFRRAADLVYEIKPHQARVAIIRSKTAEAIALQGDLIRAEYEIRRALQHGIEYDRVGHINSARILTRYTRILLDQSRLDEAENIAKAAIWSYQAFCSKSTNLHFAYARKGLAEVYTRQGKYNHVVELYKAIKRAMGEDNPVYQSRFSRDMIYLYALLQQKRYHEARLKLEEAVEWLKKNYGQEHAHTAEARGFLAIAYWKAGFNEQAKQLFEQSMEVFGNPALRSLISMHNVQIIIEAYMSMLSGEPDLNSQDIDVLFYLSEQLRNSTVEETIKAMGARAASSTPELAEIIRQEQDSRIKIKALESTFANALSENTETTWISEALEKERSSRQQALKKLEVVFPDYFNLINPKRFSLEDIKKYINPGESLISTYSGSDKTYIWVINKDRPIHFYTADISYDALERQVSRLYRTFRPSEDSLNGISAYNLNLAYRLFEKLLKPSTDSWENSHTLYIAGHGALGRMPVSALPTRKIKRLKEGGLLFEEYREVPFLVKTHAVSRIPSVSAFKTLRSINSEKTNRQPLVAFADPLYNEEYANQTASSAQQLATRGGIKLRSAPATLDMNSAGLEALPGLPETAIEVKEIARMLNISESAHIFTGNTATEEKVKSLKLNAFETIVFATHGLVPGELDGLNLPALALSSPKITASEGDGLLTADEIMNLKLNADWVILSACNTGSSGNASTEAVSGLGQAFFYAGARALLVSNWPVETNSASLLTANTFKFLSKEYDRARALQASMNEIIENGVYYDESNNEPVFSYAHPFFWAPFAQVGDAL